MSQDDSGKRRRAGLAAVIASGTKGYARLSAEEVADAAGMSLASFHELYPDQFECFASGYATAMEDLTEEIFRACRSEPTWAARMIAGLKALSVKIETEPMLLRGLLAEVHLAGAGVRRAREQFNGRFERAVDQARTLSAEPPPPISPALIVGMIETIAVRSLREEDPTLFASAIPDLMFIAVTLYLGRESAEAVCRDLGRD